MTPLRPLPLLLFLAACGGGGGAMSEPEIRETFTKATASGDGQSGVVAATLPLPLTVQVTIDGAPAAGVIVTFLPGAGSGSISPAVDTTDPSGAASRPWTLGAAAGTQTVQVSAAGFGNALTFSASATAGPPADLTPGSGQGQLQELGLSFAAPLVVKAVDAFGNPVAGVVVGWAVAGGSGTAAAPTSVTGATGNASMSIAAGTTPGGLVVRATTAALPADTATFPLTVTPVASVITIASNFFSPAHDTIPAGGAVRWVWNNGTHNVAPLSGPADFSGSVVQDAGATFGPLLFTVAGTYTYECSLHAGMTGTITVQ